MDIFEIANFAMLFLAGIFIGMSVGEHTALRRARREIRLPALFPVRSARRNASLQPSRFTMRSPRRNAGCQPAGFPAPVARANRRMDERDILNAEVIE